MVYPLKMLPRFSMMRSLKVWEIWLRRWMMPTTKVTLMTSLTNKLTLEGKKKKSKEHKRLFRSLMLGEASIYLKAKPKIKSPH